MTYKFLFPTKSNQTRFSLFLLAFRLLFGILLMSHGIQKLSNFHDYSLTFPDPLGVGIFTSLSLAIFAELFCSMAFIIGLLYRLVMLPMIFTMGMAYFVILVSNPFSAKELAFVYLAVFILMYLTGPGKYSIDYIIGKELDKKQKLADK